MKKYLLGIFAIVLAVGFSSFNTHAFVPKKKFTNGYWSYTGTTPQTPALRKDPNQYTFFATTPPTCSGTTLECAVETSSSVGTHPDFTNVTFDPNGFPNGNANGGTNFVANFKKAL